jgi:hypothetical protein
MFGANLRCSVRDFPPFFARDDEGFHVIVGSYSLTTPESLHSQWRACMHLVVVFHVCVRTCVCTHVRTHAILFVKCDTQLGTRQCQAYTHTTRHGAHMRVYV